MATSGRLVASSIGPKVPHSPIFLISGLKKLAFFCKKVASRFFYVRFFYYISTVIKNNHTYEDYYRP